MKQYLDLLQDILDNGEWKDPAREGMPRTKEIFCRTMRFNLQEGFPLLTTKKVFTKGVFQELLWFLRGETNISSLIKEGCNFWTPDAYKYYVRKSQEHKHRPVCIEEFVELISAGIVKTNIPDYNLGDLGKVYGSQWRNWGEWSVEGDLDPSIENPGFDQIENLIRSIKSNSNSRYHLVTAWNPTDFLQYPENAALPACHIVLQCSVRNGKFIDLMMLQRSCDTFLGVPFNIACYAALTHIIAKLTGYEPGEFVWVGNSIHVYENHMEQIVEQLFRTPGPLPQLELVDRNQEIVEDFLYSDFVLTNYFPQESIKGELSVGI